MNHKVICVHGFGVGADGRGLFIDISTNIPDKSFITFDLNEVDKKGNMTVMSLYKQAKLLNTQIEQNPEAETLVCHSQGCIVTSLADLEGIKKVVFLAPPEKVSIELFMQKFGHRPGAVRADNGSFSIPRRDGTETIASTEYLASIEKIDIPKLYTKLSMRVELMIVRATKDEILGLTEFSYLGESERIDISTSHDFNGEGRKVLMDELQKML